MHALRVTCAPSHAWDAWKRARALQVGSVVGGVAALWPVLIWYEVSRGRRVGWSTLVGACATHHGRSLTWCGGVRRGGVVLCVRRWMSSARGQSTPSCAVWARRKGRQAMTRAPGQQCAQQQLLEQQQGRPGLALRWPAVDAGPPALCALQLADRQEPRRAAQVCALHNRRGYGGRHHEGSGQQGWVPRGAPPPRQRLRIPCRHWRADSPPFVQPHASLTALSLRPWRLASDPLLPTHRRLPAGGRPHVWTPPQLPDILPPDLSGTCAPQLTSCAPSLLPTPGFRQVAGYIFGQNTKLEGEGAENISMTSPVRMEMEDPSKMKMVGAPAHHRVRDQCC